MDDVQTDPSLAVRAQETWARLHDDRGAAVQDDLIVDVLGTTPGDLLGQPVTALVHEGDATILRAWLDEGARTPLVARDPLGVRWHEWVASPMDQAGPMVLRGRDVTAREQAVADARDAQDRLSNLAYVASHDLREPVRMISNFTPRLVKRLDGRLDDRTTQYVELITDGATRVNKMLDALLEWSRLQREDPVPVAMSVADLVAAEVARVQEGAEGLGPEVTVAEIPPRSVQVTPHLIRLALREVLANALRHRTRDGAPRIRIDAVQDGGSIMLAIEDDGPGIAPDEWQRCFQPFRRGGERPTADDMGMGLTMARTAVEHCQGTIRVSAPVHLGGTRIEITLPISVAGQEVSDGG